MTTAYRTPRGRPIRTAGTMTFPELFQLPATVDLATASLALGIHVNTAYKLVRYGRFPCPILRPGWRYRVPTNGLLRALQIDETPVRLDDVTNGADFAAQYG
jgi:hypothetical protein